MLGLVIAEKEETATLIKTIKAKIIEFNGIRFYLAYIGDKQVVLCFCGVGKVNAAAATMSMITNFNVDKIFNIGLCGTCKPDIIPGTILIADAIENNDVDLTAFNYPLNQIPNEPIKYEVKHEYVQCLSSMLEGSKIGTIASGDSVITINNIEAYPSLANKEILGFDMEVASIAQICNKCKVDIFSVKLVSDNLTMDIQSKNQYDANYKTLAKNIEKICLKVLDKYC